LSVAMMSAKTRACVCARGCMLGMASEQKFAPCVERGASLCGVCCFHILTHTHHTHVLCSLHDIAHMDAHTL
jgi:hypothetical protein